MGMKAMLRSSLKGCESAGSSGTCSNSLGQSHRTSIEVLEPIDKYINKFQSDNVPVSDVYQTFISLTKGSWISLEFLRSRKII
ncbi:hypothetical protein PsorP6_007507 [Peronosclerospora sorghi]|uniref:Uncharacterized protein n=1 Tax=Peronosclerospora sorghi TaxID=230839 RepID=A0ACC0WB81_9STRA|nr:hypothetical protein PsorP6_007507 [Peronosclerospora sorghi]